MKIRKSGTPPKKDTVTVPTMEQFVLTLQNLSKDADGMANSVGPDQALLTGILSYSNMTLVFLTLGAQKVAPCEICDKIHC